MDNDFELFGENTERDLIPLLELINHAITTGEMSVYDGIGILADVIRPGHSDSSHDVKGMWVGAMYAFGHGDLCDEFGSIWLNSMPWGVGFQIAVRPGFVFADCTEAQQRAMVEAFAVVLRCGGLEAEVTSENFIRVRSPEGVESEMSTDDIVGQFRRAIDDELGPDAPEDPTRRWMP
jgi:hypothetical protein